MPVISLRLMICWPTWPSGMVTASPSTWWARSMSNLILRGMPRSCPGCWATPGCVDRRPQLIGIDVAGTQPLHAPARTDRLQGLECDLDLDRFVARRSLCVVVGCVGVQNLDRIHGQALKTAREDPVDVLQLESSVSTVDPRRSDRGPVGSLDFALDVWHRLPVAGPVIFNDAFSARSRLCAAEFVSNPCIFLLQLLQGDGVCVAGLEERSSFGLELSDSPLLALTFVGAMTEQD